ncbi:Small GTP-binding protein domain [Trinorchestia longiramus]|nr:Small GTP-binding protein domain [Trinorchestia longiramus]
MGMLLSRLFRLVYGKNHCRILMVGLDGAGKTTILYKMKLGEVMTTIPTIGFNVETVEYKNLELTVWDVGGQEMLRSLWRHYYQNANAVIFVVDSSDTSRFSEAKKELHITLESDELRDVPVLVWANKQDMPGSVSADTLGQQLHLNALGTRPHRCQAATAITHDGLIEGLEWLAQNIKL